MGESIPERARGSGVLVLLVLFAVGVTLALLYFRREARLQELARKEHLAAGALKILTSAQADFRANDRDGNGFNDFWIGDVAGLHTLKGPTGEPIKLIEGAIAEADVAPVNSAARVPTPYHGYSFVALDTVPGKMLNAASFGFCAYPTEWGVTGRRMFIINENNTIFECREPGPPPKAWPTDAQLMKSWTVYGRLRDPR